MHFTDPGKNRHFINLHVSFISLRNNELFWSLCAAAVDYLAKNVSLSTQRRMKLGEHSAVLGLLQVETGQAYWWISNWTSTHVFHQHPSILSAATTRGPSDYEWMRPREIQKSQAVLDFLPIAVWIQKPFHIKKQTLLCRISLFVPILSLFHNKETLSGLQKEAEGKWASIVWSQITKALPVGIQC